MTHATPASVNKLISAYHSAHAAAMCDAPADTSTVAGEAAGDGLGDRDGDDWECGNECGFSHVDYNTVAEHEKTCMAKMRIAIDDSRQQAAMPLVSGTGNT